MARCHWLALALAVLLALSSAETATTQVTNLCDAQFCLASSPASCGGNCFLTAAQGDKSFCSTKCQASWYNPTVKACLSQQAVGTFINDQITALYNVCNAATIAAAKLNASTTEFHSLFPCTKNLTSAQFDPEGLATCNLKTNATCGDTCQSALSALPASCEKQVAKNSTWTGIVTACTAAAPAPISSTGALAPGAAGLTPSSLAGLGLSPTGSPSSSGAQPNLQAAIATPMLVVALISGLLYLIA